MDHTAKGAGMKTICHPLLSGARIRRPLARIQRPLPRIRRPLPRIRRPLPLGHGLALS